MMENNTENIPFTVTILESADDEEFLNLEDAYKKSIGEAPLTEEEKQRLKTAVREGRITFFIARHEDRYAGICSIARCYSTFTSSDTGIFEDFYIEPGFRKMGIARLLCKAAEAWCRNEGISSMTVCSAPCDEEMYSALGFDTVLGRTLAHII